MQYPVNDKDKKSNVTKTTTYGLNKEYFFQDVE